jgi:aspartate aminotransferase
MLVRAPSADEGPFVEALAERGVYVLPGRMVGMPRWLRISLTATDEMCERSLDGFAGAMRAYTRRASAPPTQGVGR